MKYEELLTKEKIRKYILEKRKRIQQAVWWNKEHQHQAWRIEENKKEIIRQIDNQIEDDIFSEHKLATPAYLQDDRNVKTFITRAHVYCTLCEKRIKNEEKEVIKHIKSNEHKARLVADKL